MFNLTLGRTKEEGEGEGEGERVDAIPPKVFSEISRVKHRSAPDVFSNSLSLAHIRSQVQ